MSINSEVSSEDKPDAIHITIPRHVYMLPLSTSLLGFTLGFVRGSRKSALRYLAENAHRRPTTVQGWYFYQKTKNYRVLFGGLKEGGKYALKVGGLGVGWVGLEQGWAAACETVGAPAAGEMKEVVAGGGLAAMIAGACE
ncbi:hypothetical protein FRC02_009956 [Tulasnella sp. 418]|nr:hypothetical protein FRC02_009956 [Tulasnella sp. 418]